MSYVSGDAAQISPGVFYNTSVNGSANMDRMSFTISTGTNLTYQVHLQGTGWVTRMSSYPSQVIYQGIVVDVVFGTPQDYFDLVGNYNFQNYSKLR